jgi:hypothetical protein
MQVIRFFRICWTEGVRQQKGEDCTSTDWFPEDGAVEDMLQLMCDAGVERFGEGSHWIEMDIRAATW